MAFKVPTSERHSFAFEAVQALSMRTRRPPKIQGQGGQEYCITGGFLADVLYVATRERHR